MTRLLSKTFRSIKCNHSQLLNNSPSKSKSKSSSSSSWSVYLILSTNKPIKTYVGVTTDFPRRLKQHNGELKGGAKAAHAGKPWVCACIIHGFKDQSEGAERCNHPSAGVRCLDKMPGLACHASSCKLESKWKNCSRRLPRKKKTDDSSEKEADDSSVQLLQHRQAALNKIKGSFDFSHLEVDWKLDPS